MIALIIVRLDSTTLMLKYAAFKYDYPHNDLAMISVFQLVADSIFWHLLPERTAQALMTREKLGHFTGRLPLQTIWDMSEVF